MKSFLADDFLLTNEIAIRLFHEYAQQMPIYDYHCHLDPREIYENRRFENLTELWLGGDHYKWRLMRFNGVSEDYITGGTSDREKFQKFAEALPRAIGNPMYHWCHLELKNYFGYAGILNGETAQTVWDLTKETMQSPDFCTRALISRSNVAMVGTTDDPCSDLQCHKLLADSDFETKVCPSFRPDPAIQIYKPGFAAYLQKLQTVTGMELRTVADVAQALSSRMVYFASMGCRAADHGLDYVMFRLDSEEACNAVLRRAMAGEPITVREAEGYETRLLLHCAWEYARLGWAMQLHFSCMRNPNSRMLAALGPDSGFDCIADTDSCRALFRLMDTLERENNLPKTILYSLNPADNAWLDSLIGAFQGCCIPGKIQHGSAWWFNDHKLPGEVWEVSEIAEVQKQLEPYGFNMDVVESVNVHDDIKIGLPTRDHYIETYRQTIRNLAQFGVKVICCNFMPIFDWTRTDLFHPVGDGSTALFYQKDQIQKDYQAMASYILNFTEKYNLSFLGWEPERMARLDALFQAYEGVEHETLWANLKYFLEAIMPVCHECDIKMAIHMDDPPWDIFGLPRLLVDEPSIERFLRMVDDPYNCLTLCSGSLSANAENDVAAIVRKHCDRIAFAHIRNVKRFPNGDFSEASHRDCDGDTGILEIMRAYHDCGFSGYIRPDYGRHLWDEGPGNVRPGYGLYDRAMGIVHLWGIWDALERAHRKILRDLGLCDILINGAGGNNPRATTDNEYQHEAREGGQSFFDLQPEGVDAVFRLNFQGTLLPTQVFGKDMTERRQGVILNISSMNAYISLTKIPAYSAAKAAVSNFTQWLSTHFAGSGIRCNAIAPGFLVSTQNRALLFHEDGTPTARSAKILAGTPMPSDRLLSILCVVLVWISPILYAVVIESAFISTKKARLSAVQSASLMRRMPRTSLALKRRRPISAAASSIGRAMSLWPDGWQNALSLKKWPLPCGKATLLLKIGGRACSMTAKRRRPSSPESMS